MAKSKFLDAFNRKDKSEEVDVLAADPTNEVVKSDEGAQDDGEDVMPKEEGVTLLRVPYYNAKAYITAKRVYTYGEIVPVDQEGVARCRTDPAVTALLIRGFTRIQEAS